MDRIGIKKDNILPYIVLICLYHLLFVGFTYLQYYNIIQLLLVGIIALYLLLNYKQLFFKFNKNLIIMFLFYSSFIIFGSYLNRNNYLVTNTFISSIRHSLILLETIISIPLLIRKLGLNKLIACILTLSCIYCIITDAQIIIGYKIMDEFYILGNKFGVAYTHLQLLVFSLLYFKYNNKNSLKIGRYLVIILIVLANIIFDVWVGSTSGILGVAIILIFYFIPQKILANPITYLILFGVCAAFPFIYDVFLKNENVTIFITEILDKDLSLTGRTIIYNHLPTIISQSPLYGHGFGTSYEIFKNFISFPNSQNGFFDVVVEQGYIGASILTLIFTFILFKTYKNDGKSKYLLLLIYAFTFLSSIEITISKSYVFYFILYYYLNKNNTLMD